MSNIFQRTIRKLIFPYIKEEKEEFKKSDPAQLTEPELRYRTLLRVTNVINQNLDINEVRQKIVDVLAREMNYPGGILFDIDKEKKIIYPLTATNTKLVNIAIGWLDKKLGEYNVSIDNPDSKLVESYRLNMLIETNNQYDFLRPVLPENLVKRIDQLVGIKSTFAAPIKYNGEIRAIIMFESLREKMSDVEREVIEAFTNIAGVALQNAELFSELKIGKEKITDLARMQEDIIDVMGHELRTPLTTIKQGIVLQEGITYPIEKNLIEGTATIEEIKKSFTIMFDTFRTIDRAATHTIALINDMLESARLDKKRFELNYELFDLVEVIGNTVDVMSKAFITGQSGYTHTITFQHPNIQHQAIEADKARLEEAIYAILNNSIKYKDPNKANLRIDVELKLENDLADIIIKDNGIGMDPKDIPLLGKKFVRLNPRTGSDLKRPGGTGLGLFVVKGILEYHKGRLIIESKGIGQGATVILQFPLKKPVELYTG